MPRPCGQQAIEVVHKVHAQGERLAELVTKLLDMGTIGAGRLAVAREPLDLLDVVRAVVARWQEQIAGAVRP